ncbi:MAG: sigma-70 family RNA polymerase sigma factor [Gammaproteobacteria bacterium]|nr:sigma-70 family RNA polymerase sigma factor [Gammaproteobacteria bacterium]
MATLVENQNRFSELLERLQGIVGKVAGTYCWHPDDRDELSQEIVTQLWRSFAKFDDSQTFSTWMYRVALNVSISWLRRHRIRQKHMTVLGSATTGHAVLPAPVSGHTSSGWPGVPASTRPGVCWRISNGSSRTLIESNNMYDSSDSDTAILTTLTEVTGVL